MLILKNKKIYILLLGLFLLTFIIRASGIWLPSFIAQHISNFIFTGGLYMLFAYELLTKKGFTKKQLLLTMLPLALLNIILELSVHIGDIKLGFFTFMNFNTPDVLDIPSGILALVLIYLVIVHSSELKTKPLK